VIQAGAITRVGAGKAFTDACFLGYSFQVSGVRYAGLFVVFADPEKQSQIQKDLPGQVVRIRYMPSDPNISFLENKYDPRFGWCAASQDPRWLGQAPSFDLADTMRK